MKEFFCKKCKNKEYEDKDNSENKKSNTYSIEDLKKEEKEESNKNNKKICSVCGGELSQNCSGVSFRVPVYDLAYSKSFKRFQNGLHYDTTQRDKDKTHEANAEMRHNNTYNR